MATLEEKLDTLWELLPEASRVAIARGEHPEMPAAISDTTGIREPGTPIAAENFETLFEYVRKRAEREGLV